MKIIKLLTIIFALGFSFTSFADEPKKLLALPPDCSPPPKEAKGYLMLSCKDKSKIYMYYVPEQNSSTETGTQNNANDNYPAELREFVTKAYTNGLPYKEAKKFNAGYIVSLGHMLNDQNYAAYQNNIILLIGIIGDESGIKILNDHLLKQKGELKSVSSILTIFQAFGYIAQKNEGALKILIDWSNPRNWNADFSYKNYKGASMAQFTSRMAIQGLGLSGRDEAMYVLKKMSNENDLLYNAKLQNDVKNAIVLIEKTQSKGID